MRTFFAAILFASCFTAGAQGVQRAPFALLGDVPYNQSNANLLDGMIDEINGEKPAFVVHLGDITNRDCSDAWLEARANQFTRFSAPFVLVPGDNEWTDCHLAGFDPLERLAKLRRLFFSQAVNLPGFTRQPGAFPEHVRWTHSGALFVGINVPGSNNNLGRTNAMDVEHATRMKVVFAWLDDSAALAKSSPEVETLVVLMQANPDFEAKHRPLDQLDGYAELRAKLEIMTQRLGKPLVVIHGDTHRFKHDRPSKNAPGLVRIEVDGWPWMGWVKARMTPDAANPIASQRRLYQ